MRPQLEVAALGLIQGAAELLPVSSSAHVAAVPRLLGWDVASWEPARRKELEVALHAGAALALAPALLRTLPDLRTLALSLAPPVVAGYLLEAPIEERLSGPRPLALGLALGAAALAAADRKPVRRGPAPVAGESVRSGRAAGLGEPTTSGRTGEAGEPVRSGPEPVAGEPARPALSTGLALGLAQAAALVPGVSRTGATLAAARALGYSREEASRLSFGVAGPVLVGATVLKAWRARKSADVALLATGVAAAFVGTRFALRAFGLERREPLWPYAAERAVLAILLLRYRRAP